MKYTYLSYNLTIFLLTTHMIMTYDKIKGIDEKKKKDTHACVDVMWVVSLVNTNYRSI